MKKEEKKNEKLKMNSEEYKICYTNFEGITLVALVITIIVLIILAGVSINAVMNGGLIDNAKDAKNEYEEAKQNETQEISSLEQKIAIAEQEIIDTEVNNDFKTKKTVGYNNKEENAIEYTAYLFNNGLLTGVTTSENATETVSDFRKKLPEGYDIYTVDGGDISADDTTTLVANGMIIKKETTGGKKQVGRVIVFGDLSSDGQINVTDMNRATYIMNNTAYQYGESEIVAMDANHDGIINPHDYEILHDIVWSNLKDTINQNVNATPLYELTIKNVQSYREKVSNFENFKTSQFSIEWNETEREYELKGVTETTTVEEIIAVLPDDDIIVVVNDDGDEVTTGAVGEYYGICLIGVDYFYIAVVL